MVIKAVIGANFGDEGKGLMVDYFCRQSNGRSLVVLTNGGPQRGHTVNYHDKRHVFHHFGSGTFAGADTYIAEDFIVNPMVFFGELAELYKDFKFNIFINTECRVTTPWDMIANQQLEIMRGENRHGSCGMGIWETVQRSKEIPLNVSDDVIEDKLADIRKYYRSRIKDFGVYESVFDNPDLEKHFLRDWNTMREMTIPAFDLRDFMLGHIDTLIFENGQGLLLDQDNEKYYPHVTASSTGLAIPMKLLKNIDYTSVEACYVTRSYVTRHGAGPLDFEVERSFGEDETNVENMFQGKLRFAHNNYVEMIRRIYNDAKPYPKTKITVAVTHLNEHHPDWVDGIADYKSYNKYEVIKEK